jgi:hypothetical protein
MNENPHILKKEATACNLADLLMIFSFLIVNCYCF